MGRILAISLVVAANLLGGGVARAEMITADPSAIAKVLKDAGYQAAISKDDGGDPLISSMSSGSKFLILFYYCKDHVNCASVQFFAGYEKPKNGSVDALNKWNSKHNFSRAYVSDKGQARIEMDVNLDKGGMSPALFRDNFDTWIALMANFEDYIGGD